MRGNHTNNYVEAGMRILKEIIFGRIKAYNLIHQMFQFITVTMEKYFINRLLGATVKAGTQERGTEHGTEVRCK